MLKKSIPVAKISVPDVRVTAVYDEEHLALLRDTVATMGILQPIVVVKVGEEYQLVDGLHRLNEAKNAGDAMIDAVIYEGDARDTLLKNLVLNQVRGKTRASEMVKVIGELTDRYGMDSEAVAKATGLTRDYIEKLWAISRAAPTLQEALDRELIGVGVAYEISRLPSPVQQEEVIAKYQVYRFSVKEIKSMIDNVLEEMRKSKEQGAPKTEPLHIEPPRYFCEGCSKETAPRYLRPVQLCPDCFGLVWEKSHSTTATEKGNDKTGAPP